MRNIQQGRLVIQKLPVMYKSKIKSHYVKFRKQRLCQGDILQNISFTMRLSGVSDNEDKIELPYAVVMSQDCDIDLDYQKRNTEKELLRTYNFIAFGNYFKTRAEAKAKRDEIKKILKN